MRACTFSVIDEPSSLLTMADVEKSFNELQKRIEALYDVRRYPMPGGGTLTVVSMPGWPKREVAFGPDAHGEWWLLKNVGVVDE